MSATPAPTETSPAARVALIILGILFILIWIAAHLVWGTMALMANVMANDSGSVSADQHSTLILGMLAGQVAAGAAGIPAGLAFFWRGKRKLLLWLFALLFLAGAAAQVLAFSYFFTTASTTPA